MIPRPTRSTQTDTLCTYTKLFRSASFHVQWAHFSSWLIAGGLLVGAFALLWALIGLFRGGAAGRGRRSLYFVVLLVMWALGFVNALVHAKDAWATMPEGLYLSVITTLLALVAAWIGYSGVRAGEAAGEVK